MGCCVKNYKKSKILSFAKKILEQEKSNNQMIIAFLILLDRIKNDLYKKTTYLPSAAFLASLFNFKFSQIVPPIQ